MESFWRESFYYVLFAGGVQCVGALLIAAIYFPLAIHFTGSSFTQLLWPYLLFNLFLLFWGCLGHYAFIWLTFDKLYFSADRVVDWYPFIPFGQWVLDQTLGPIRGYLIDGATLWQLRLIWGAVALPVWLLTYVSTIRALQYLGMTNILQQA